MTMSRQFNANCNVYTITIYIYFLRTITPALYQRNTIAFIETWNDHVCMTHAAFRGENTMNGTDSLEFFATRREEN